MTSSIQLKDGIANTVANDQPQGMIISFIIRLWFLYFY